MTLPTDLKNYHAPEQSDSGIFWLCVLALLVCLMWGCASMTDDLREHEAWHCRGWVHEGTAPSYSWTKVREESAQPWLTVRVDDPDSTCRIMGADPQRSLMRVAACAVWQPVGCTIILPKN